MNNSVKSVIAIILLAVVINVVLLSVNMNPIVPTGGQPEDPLEAWSESSVIIWQYNSTFYAARNMSTNMVIDLVSNLTRLEENMLGNMTTGLLYLIEVQHNGTLTVGATQSVMAQYHGSYTFTNVTGSYQFGVGGATGPAGPAGTANGLPYSYLIFNNATATYMVNGTTGAVDYQSTNATKVIQFGINNASALTNGGLVDVKDGNYLVSGTPIASVRGYALTPKSNVYLRLSQGARIYQNAPASLSDSVSLMLFDNSMGALENFTIDGGIWDGNCGSLRDHRTTGTWAAGFASYFGIGIYYPTGTPNNINIKNLLVENVIGQGIDVGGCYNVKIDNCRVIAAGDNPITIEGAVDPDFNLSSVISRCYVKGGQDIGINVFKGCGVDIIDCVATNVSGYVGAGHIGIALEQSQHCTITNCLVLVTVGMDGGMQIMDPPQVDTDIGNRIIGGSIIGYGSASSLQTKLIFSEVNGLTIEGGGSSQLYGSGTWKNIIFDHTGAPKVSSDVADSNNMSFIQDCTFIDTLLELGDNYITVSGCKFVGNSWIFTSWAASHSHLIIEHNDFTGSTATPPVDIAFGGGTPTLSMVRWNSNHKTEGSASGINATSTTWTFTVANVTAILRAYVSFNATVSDPYWSATGTTLTVTAAAIIAGNNTACYVEWYCWNYP